MGSFGLSGQQRNAECLCASQHPHSSRWATGLRQSTPGLRTLARSVVCVLVLSVIGCGTTRWTDTQRTLTEQWLVSSAIDEAVAQIDFSVLRDKPVFLDSQYLDLLVVDKGYLISSVRQVLLANGCLLQEDRNKATYVVELRSGGIGTDRHDVLFGLPQMNIPTFYLTQGLPAQTPEIAVAKSTKQIGGAKIEVFAYNRLTGQPVWQSGIAQHKSLTRARWFLGIGPFQTGSVSNGTRLAGEPVPIPFMGVKEETEPIERVPIAFEAIWERPARKSNSTADPQGPATMPQISTLPSLDSLVKGEESVLPQTPPVLIPAGVSNQTSIPTKTSN